MPVIVPKGLPAEDALLAENIFVMNDSRATSQDIRPLRIAIVNLMPKKIETEIQFIRLLSNSPLQIDMDLIRISDHESKNTSIEHLEKFYKKFEDIKRENIKYDGMIITGAPVEHLDFKAVNYWKELQEIFDYAIKNVHSTIFVCWASQAALYHYYNIDKRDSDKKIFGVYDYNIREKSALMRGFDDIFYMPQSRHTYIKEEDLEGVKNLKILASRDDVGINIVTSLDERLIFIAGHGEYDRETLNDEYTRDVNKGLDIDIPINYFKDDDPKKGIIVNWKTHTNLLFSNWLNYCVYQDTPYDIETIEEVVL